MRADAIVFGIAGSLFGLIIGWVLGTQNATGAARVAAPVAQAAPATAGAPAFNFLTRTPHSAPRPTLFVLAKSPRFSAKLTFKRLFKYRSGVPSATSPNDAT